MLTHEEALAAVTQHRGKRLVVATMTSAGVWPSLSDSPLDFLYLPSAMGQAPALGIGLALAQPDRGVIVFNGDGCTLMNLGSLVTLAESGANVFLLIFDNRLYEVTGGQALAGAGQVDFAGLARSAGIRRVYSFDSAEAWRARAAEALSGRGPVVISLRVEGRFGQRTPTPPRPMSEQMARFLDALGTRLP